MTVRDTALSLAAFLAIASLCASQSFGQSVQTAPVDDPSAAGRALRSGNSGVTEDAIAFIRALNEAVSGTDEQAQLAIAKAYAPIVDFYGKPQTAAAILKEKNAIFRRWPVRSYSVVDAETKAECDPAGQICDVSALVRWKVSSPARKAESAGLSRMKFQIRFSDLGPAIVGEAGETLARE
jgi:hypothetical protein